FCPNQFPSNTQVTATRPAAFRSPHTIERSPLRGETPGRLFGNPPTGRGGTTLAALKVLICAGPQTLHRSLQVCGEYPLQYAPRSKTYCARDAGIHRDRPLPKSTSFLV